MDWKKCIFCQKETKNPLLGPSNSKNNNSCGYSKLFCSIHLFQNEVFLFQIKS